MSLLTPNQSMQKCCSVTTLPPAVPREDISSLLPSSSGHQDCIRLLEIWFLLHGKVVLRLIQAFWLFFLGRDFTALIVLIFAAFIAHFTKMPSRRKANWNLSKTSKSITRTCQSCDFCWFPMLGPLCIILAPLRFHLEESLVREIGASKVYSEWLCKTS